MIPDAELLSLLSTVLTRLDVGEFTIKVGTPLNGFCAFFYLFLFPLYLVDSFLLSMHIYL